MNEESKSFASNYTQETVCAHALVWVGFTLSPDYQAPLVRQKLPTEPIEAPDKTKSLELWILTKDGQVINHVEYMEKVAQNKGSQVLMVDDYETSCLG